MGKDNKTNNKFLSEKITRKKAIKKVGVTAFTAATLLFLETKKGSAASPTLDRNDSPREPGRNWD